MSAPLLHPAAQAFVTFSALLRAHDFSVAPEQTTSLMEAVIVLGPRDLDQVRRAAHATLAPPPERRAAFDALFDAHFLHLSDGLKMPADGDEAPLRVQEERRGISEEPPLSDEINEAGQEAARGEALSVRRFAPAPSDAVLRDLGRRLPDRLPRRRAYRLKRAPRGQALDLRRSLRESLRTDGDVFTLRRLKRLTRQRNMLLLIDVSGSMKQATERHLELAHVLVQTLPRVEVFTFGTRLTRLTNALKLKNRDQALAAASNIVSDWDGGTRIGDALRAFLAMPRFAGYARGAIVVVLSDGLERGDFTAMQGAVQRLKRRAWRIDWLSPLAIGKGFRPRTEALQAIMPSLDFLGDGSSLAAIAHRLLNADARRAP